MGHQRKEIARDRENIMRRRVLCIPMQNYEIGNAMYLLLFTAHIQSNNRINSWNCPLLDGYASILCLCFTFTCCCISHLDLFGIYLRCFDSLSICSIWNWCTIGSQFCHHRSFLAASSLSLVICWIFSAYASRSNLCASFFPISLYLCTFAK